MNVPTLRERASGVLLHPTCLPGPHGSGDLEGARGFVQFLQRAGQRWWQMLPIGPPGYGESPYSAQSAFAASPWLLSLEALAEDKLLDRSALAGPALAGGRVDYLTMQAHRSRLLRKAHDAFTDRQDERAAFERFCERSAFWLDDFALFRALKHAHGGVQWTRWDVDVRRREPRALAAARTRLARDVDFEKFLQFELDKQWTAFRAYAEAHGIGLVGDIPIFVAHDSADVWQTPDAFFLGDDGEPTVIAGVPPDYFSRTGQRWGNPLYRWRRMKVTGYAWWIARLRSVLERFHAVRLDHFIGFQRYWEIPASEPTAKKGRWMKGPGADLFLAVKDALGQLPLLAEDLGVVTPAVLALRDRFRLPGTKILQFAFGADPSAPTFLPHNFARRAVVYTGTHDNDTTVGWFHEAGGGESTRSTVQTARERDAALRYLGTTGQEIHWDMIRLALGSVARLSVVPLQDVLGLGTEARMNWPGKESGNWSWRFEREALTEGHAARLASLVRTYGRAAPGVEGEAR